jgi:hypothetical protein
VVVSTKILVTDTLLYSLLVKKQYSNLNYQLTLVKVVLSTLTENTWLDLLMIYGKAENLNYLTSKLDFHQECIIW